MDDSVNGEKPSPPENGTNEPAEQNNSSDEYEDKSPKIDSRMTGALELGDSANLEQAIRKINENGKKMVQMCSTSSPLSFDNNISEFHKYLEKLDQSSIHSTASDTEMCAKEVSTSDKTPNVPSRAALMEFERLRQEFDQKLLELKQELMSKQAKASNGMNDVRAVSGTVNWSEGESSSKTGSFIEESENRQLAECRDIIENTPILRGSLAGKTKRGLRENTEKDLSENVLNLSEDLSNNVGGPVEHCNVFAKTRDKPEAGNESSKNTAHDLDVTLQKQETEMQSEVRQIQSLQINRSSVEELHVEKDKRSDRNRAKDELKPAFDHRIKRAMLGLFVVLLIGLTLFGLAWLFTGFGVKLAQKNSKGLTYYNTSTQIEDLKKSLEAEIEQRRKTESELKLAYENSKIFSQDKAPTQREVEELRNNLYAEIKERRKTESELKLAQEKLRRDKEKAENDIKRVALICCTLFIVVLFGLGIAEIIEQRKAESERKLVQENLEELRRDKEKAENAAKDLQNSLDAEIEQRRKTESELKLAQENLEGMRLGKAKAENATKDLRKSLDAEIEERRKTETELQLVQENLEESRRDKEKAENAAKDLQNSLDAEIEQRRKTESELKLAQENLEELAHYKAISQRQIEELQNSLEAESTQRRKAESELELAQENLEGMRRDKEKAENDLKRNLDALASELKSAWKNLEELAHYKAKSQRQMEEFRNSLDVKLQSAQENLEELRRDNAKAENDLKSKLDELARYKATSQRQIEDLQNSLDAEIELRLKAEEKLNLAQQNLEELRRYKVKVRETESKRAKAESELKSAWKNLEGMRRDKEKAENATKDLQKQRRKTESELKSAQQNLEELQRKFAKEPFARSDVVIVKSEMKDRQMQNDAIQIMIESMKECTRASAVTKFISGKMREKYRGTEWICFISDGKPNPIVLDYNYSLSVYLKMDVVFIELICSVFDA